MFIYTIGDIAALVIGTLVITLLIVGCVTDQWQKWRNK